MAITAATTVTLVKEKFPQAVLETVEFRDEQTLVLEPTSLLSVCAYLQKSLRYNFLSTVTAVDWPERTPRFDVVYQLLSLPNQCVLRLKVRVGKRGEEHPSVPSVTSLWPGANWYEREIYDLFGLTFAGHPDLRRIMMPPDWTTHPLRKDYPLAGFDLPEPHWGGQVPYDTDPGVGSQTLRSADGRELNDNRSSLNPNQEPGTLKKE
jgi:NADH-quinone oxidoreductase subunit C